MKLALYQIDAFSNQVFAGNPAAVVPLTQWLPDAQLQHIAAENNLSETAYFVARDDGSFDLRWFTPTTEVDLCGHATLASAWVLFNALGYARQTIEFHCQAGALTVTRDDDKLLMDFPARAAAPVDVDDQVVAALGLNQVREMALARDLLVVLDDAETLRQLTPDFSALAQLEYFGICVTAPGQDCDFVSRFFAPTQGINEDPVTGSAHCTLVPYWQQRLQRQALHARQLSPRGGELFCRLQGDRVIIGGYAACYLHGEISLP